MLTAHPTEVQRKSLLDAELAIADLLAQRDGLEEGRERERNEALLRTRITQLWQTRLLRYRKLTVRDEIEKRLELLPNDVSCARSLGSMPNSNITSAAPHRPSSAWANWIGGGPRR